MNEPLCRFGIYPSRRKLVTHLLATEQITISEIVSTLLTSYDGQVDGLALSLVSLHGADSFANVCVEQFNLDYDTVLSNWEDLQQTILSKDACVTGADALAAMMYHFGITHVFAYPGTSELVLCESIARTGFVKLVNGRGDAECVFEAAGLSMWSPGRGLAILHGARGATNALGAICNARRNELAVLCIVGMPSTSYQRFLPPHGEPDLIEGLTHFAKSGHVAPHPFPQASLEERQSAAQQFLSVFAHSFDDACSYPTGPTLFGLPQDVAEERWIPAAELLQTFAQTSHELVELNSSDIQTCLKIIQDHDRPAILVDDIFYRKPGSKAALKTFSEAIGAPIFQVAYRRGAMLFEQPHQRTIPTFVGRYIPDEIAHQDVIKQSNLIITIDDRNCYQRVVGDLPNCRKIAITSNPSMTSKNQYLSHGDCLASGDPISILNALSQRIGPRTSEIVLPSLLSPKPQWDVQYEPLRKMLPCAVAQCIALDPSPVIIDDSQMFGAVFTENYDTFPENLRVFGDHSGFVGAGIGFATGLAVGNPTNTVWCLTGDQAFLNGSQAIACAAEVGARLRVIVCNNGGSVSLIKQMSAQNPSAFDSGSIPFLSNSPRYSVVHVAEGLGAVAESIKLGNDDLLKDALARLHDSDGPAVLEIMVPGNLGAWKGIWKTKGLDGR